MPAAVEISDLPAAQPLSGIEVLAADQGAVTVRIPLDTLRVWIAAGLATAAQGAKADTAVQPGTAATLSGLVVTLNGSALPGSVPVGTVARVAGANGALAVSLVDAFGNGAAFGGRRASGTAEAPSAVSAGALLCALGGYGYAGTGYSAPARATVRLTASETWTDTAQGAQVSVATTAAGSTSTTVRWTFADAGHQLPAADNAYTFGGAGQRVAEIFVASSVVATSDRREKADVSDCPLGLGFIRALRPVAFRWINGRTEVTTVPDGVDEGGEPKVREVVGSRPGRRVHLGFVAQEVRAALPDGTDWAMWTLDDPQDTESRQGLRIDHIVPPLVRAVQEQQAQIDVMSTRLAALEAHAV